MPQFELVFYLSQAFWMLISFGFLYLLVDYVLFPMIYDVMDERKRLISENLAAAEKANKDAERVMKAYQDYLLTAEQEASALIQKAYQDTNRLTSQTHKQYSLQSGDYVYVLCIYSYQQRPQRSLYWCNKQPGTQNI